ncbi:hypothetical protein HNR77_000580 [Paenibacillus sp. JGP012]|uniref:hypothetical protein n=1 Tax=Paenibacillus sp. JGP012 TaxID=2735914 RepID=UPI00160C1D0A|nr:hypothetical protein [Paenibacillus sp. JGP012]MBB6019519.1 hypothetical protein [Paenibacillus sp. JGP012]
MQNKQSLNKWDGNNGVAEARHELQLRLIVAEKQITANESLMDHEQVMNGLRIKIKAAQK